MRAFILAGGLGTRIRPVLGDIPKPLAPIRGKPFLEYQLNLLKSNGFEEVVISVGYKKEEIKRRLGDGRQLGIKLIYSEEDENNLLGTGGALRKAEPLLKDSDFLLCNGDSYVWGNLREMFETHVRNRALATIGYVRVDKPVKGGFLNLEGDRVISFQEGVGTGFINAGFIAFSPEVFRYMPEREAFSLEVDLLPALVGTERVRAFSLGDKLLDIGTPSGYEMAKVVL